MLTTHLPTQHFGRSQNLYPWKPLEVFAIVGEDMGDSIGFDGRD